MYVMGEDGQMYELEGPAPIRVAPNGRPGAIAPQGRMLRLPPKPQWREGEVAPGVYGPNTGEEILPLGTVVFEASGPTTATLLGRPQRPFQGLRLVVSIARSGTSATALVNSNGIFVGTQPQLVEVNEFSLDAFSPVAVGAGLRFTPAQPGVDVKLSVVLKGEALASTDLIIVTAQVYGNTIR